MKNWNRDPCRRVCECTMYIYNTMYVVSLVTAADNDMDKVGNSFLQLKMVLNKGSEMEEVFMGEATPTNYIPPCTRLYNHNHILFSLELTLPQFYSFLHEMEKAKASLEYLS